MGLQAMRKVAKQGLTKGTAREDELVMPQETNTVSGTQPRYVARVQQMAGSCSYSDGRGGGMFTKSTIRSE